MDSLDYLAEKISNAGRLISKESICKEYIVGENFLGRIKVCSDSGYESICIGNTERESTDGFMLLYTNNTPKRNSFPNKKVIKKLLEKVLNKEKLETNEGKAEYFDWSEFGGLEKQLQYFSEVVSGFLCKNSEF